MRGLAVVLGLSLFAHSTFAASTTSGFAIGAFGGVINTEQTSLNTLITRANTRAGGISTSGLTQAYEGGFFFMYRFDNTPFALQLRPSYFYQAEDGTGSDGSYEYALNGFTIFPIFRVYPLENEFMKFYMQLGLGFGHLRGEVQEAAAKVEFAGSSFGTLTGLGAEFCFTPNHCVNFEGNYRYLVMERNIVTKSEGTFASDSFTNYSKGNELEMDNNDVATRMSGLMFTTAYTYWF